MRIGILTFHLGPNHGGYLQAHCLCRHVEAMGHDVEIINYKNARHHHNEIFRPWIYRRPLKLYQGILKNRAFAKAFKELPLSPFTTDVREVEWDRYDAVLIGSDVVWDFSWEWLGRDPVYFGDFGGDYRGRTIAYAPSTGTVKSDAQIPEWVSRGLASMDVISARDETTAAIVARACGRQAPLVLDPTWLDIGLREEAVTENRQLVVYSVSIHPKFRSAILTYARRHGLEIVALGYYHPWADRNLLKVGPLEWVKEMRGAAAVVAGTFHGTLYAIKNQSNFVTVLNERILSRVGRALDLCGLSSRGVDRPEDLVRALEKPINYRDAMERLQPHVEASSHYLESSLG